MKRKVAQRETQCAHAHARSNSGSEECDKVRRTGQTPIFFGSAESDVDDDDDDDDVYYPRGRRPKEDE